MLQTAKLPLLKATEVKIGIATSSSAFTRPLRQCSKYSQTDPIEEDESYPDVFSSPTVKLQTVQPCGTIGWAWPHLMGATITISPDWRSYLRNIKLGALIGIWLMCSVALLYSSMWKSDIDLGTTKHQMHVLPDTVQNHLILEQPYTKRLRVRVKGPFLPSHYSSLTHHWLRVWVKLLMVTEMPTTQSGPLQISKIALEQNVSESWNIPLVSESLADTVPLLVYERTFNPSELVRSAIRQQNSSALLLRLLELEVCTMNWSRALLLNVDYDVSAEVGNNDDGKISNLGLVCGACVLLLLYGLIIMELVHRTVAAMLACALALALLAVLDARPSLTEIISWIEMETLLLLFAMMVLVTILGETGIFDFVAVLAYKVTHGQVWPLINALSGITAALSCCLDNVTTALLITPVTIRLCEVMQLNPVPVLIYMLMCANIGGAVTPIGDPPNVIIASNVDVKQSGVTFGVFTMHMGFGSLLALGVVYVQLRFAYRNTRHFHYSEPNPLSDIRRECKALHRVAQSVSEYSCGEANVRRSLLRRSALLADRVHRASANSPGIQTPSSTGENGPCKNYAHTLRHLQLQYPIRDWPLLIKSSATLALVIGVFFLHSLPVFSHFGLGLTALLGALLLLILYDNEHMDSVFGRIEWSTLLFFAALFILMEALSRLGLIEWIGVQTQHVIMSVEQESRLTVAIILILWVSGLVSAFVDNLPLTAMMVKIATELARNKDLGLPLQPLIWALSFGACFGGNGTLFGSSSNIVCAGVAEQHGYRFTFFEFIKVGLPVTITSMSVITVYLVLCHSVFHWH